VSWNKRKALEPLNPNIPLKKPKIGRTMPTEAPLIPLLRLQSETRLESSIRPVPLPESHPQTPLPIPPPILESRPQTPLPVPLPKSRPQTPLPVPPPILKSRPQTPLPIPLPESRPQASLLPLPPSVQPAGFLPADQWKLIQDFYTALDGVKMEYCLRCRERWFSMSLRHEICDTCFLRDKGS
jgi:hypothetical protein